MGNTNNSNEKKEGDIDKNNSEEKNKKKNDNENNENKNEIKEESNINKIKNEEANLIKKENEEYFQISFKSFKSHFINCESEIKNDLKNLKAMKTPQNIRDLLWLLFLGVLPYKSSEEWNKRITEERITYTESKNKLISKNIEEFIITKKIKDKYSEYFKFKEILSKEDYDFLDIIKVDVTRTFQKVDLFKEEKIQKILTNILFIFAKKNKNIGYRQGMSDLCAIFLYVMHKEKILDADFIKDNKAFNFYLLYSNNEFLEHDTYALFSRFMLKGYIQFFLYNDEKYINGDLAKFDTQKRKILKMEEIINANDSELKKRIFLVYYHEFPLIDKQLYQFMVDKIDPEIFIVRWYICAFSREFPLPELVQLWDLILYQQFLEDKNKSKNKNETNYYYKFVDYIVLSMLINIKTLIMKQQNPSKLMAFLMKYPKEILMKDIYLKALEIYNKSKGNLKI